MNVIIIDKNLLNTVKMDSSEEDIDSKKKKLYFIYSCGHIQRISYWTKWKLKLMSFNIINICETLRTFYVCISTIQLELFLLFVPPEWKENKHNLPILYLLYYLVNILSNPAESIPFCYTQFCHKVLLLICTQNGLAYLLCVLISFTTKLSIYCIET